MRPGVSLKPKTPIEEVYPLVCVCNFVMCLILSSSLNMYTWLLEPDGTKLNQIAKALNNIKMKLTGPFY